MTAKGTGYSTLFYATALKFSLISLTGFNLIYSSYILTVYNKQYLTLYGKKEIFWSIFHTYFYMTVVKVVLSEYYLNNE